MTREHHLLITIMVGIFFILISFACISIFVYTLALENIIIHAELKYKSTICIFNSDSYIDLSTNKLHNIVVYIDNSKNGDFEPSLITNGTLICMFDKMPYYCKDFYERLKNINKTNNNNPNNNKPNNSNKLNNNNKKPITNKSNKFNIEFECKVPKALFDKDIRQQYIRTCYYEPCVTSSANKYIINKFIWLYENNNTINTIYNDIKYESNIVDYCEILSYIVFVIYVTNAFINYVWHINVSYHNLIIYYTNTIIVLNKKCVFVYLWCDYLIKYYFMYNKYCNKQHISEQHICMIMLDTIKPKQAYFKCNNCVCVVNYTTMMYYWSNINKKCVYCNNFIYNIEMYINA